MVEIGLKVSESLDAKVIVLVPPVDTSLEIADCRTFIQLVCLQQYLPTQNTLTKSLILISMRGNKSQTL